MKIALALIAALIILPVIGYFLFPRPLLNWVRDRLRAKGKLTEHRVRVGEFDWPYLEGGRRGAAPLVLVHGFGGDKDNWAMLAPHLTGDYHLIIPDLLGFGDNARPEQGPYDIVSQAQRLVAFLDAMGIEQCHLAGNSMGGWVALQVALDAPARLSSLILLNNAGVTGTEQSVLEQLPRDGVSPLVAQSASDLKRLMAFIVHKPRYIPSRFLDVLFEDRASHTALLDKIFWTIVEDAEHRPLNARLKDVQAPTLIIWGRYDQLIHVSCAAVLESGIARAESVVFDDVGHVPMIERPRDTAAAITTFLAKYGH